MEIVYLHWSRESFKGPLSTWISPESYVRPAVGADTSRHLEESPEPGDAQGAWAGSARAAPVGAATRKTAWVGKAALVGGSGTASRADEVEQVE